MSLLISGLPVILYVLLATSSATVLLLLLSFMLRSSRRARNLQTLTKAAGIITTTGALFVSLVNITKPIGVTEKPDEAKQAIERFYAAIEDRNFDSAYRLIHRARIEQIREKIPTFGRDDFKATYITTRSYRNLFVSQVSSNNNDVSNRIYDVSFDVSDEIPRSRLYDMRHALVKDLVDKHILNADSLITLILDNLKESFDVPQSAEPAVRDYVLNRNFESLIDPIFLSEIQRNLANQYPISLKSQGTGASTMLVWRHFRQKLHVAPEDNSWKILAGLADPIAIAVYLSGASP